MIDNTPLLHQLLADNQIEMQDGACLHANPVALPDIWDFSRVEGMLLGLAIGDALGNTSESLLPATRRQQFGEIRDYLANRHAGNQAVGLPSDDSQLAFWTLEALLEDRGLVPDHLARKFSQNRIFGIGSTVKAFLRSYKDGQTPWERAGQPSAGNGALMRIAPVLIPHLRQPSPALWADAALAGMVTHNDRASNACCVAFIHILWECLCLSEPPEPGWWIDTFVNTAKELEGNTRYPSQNPNLTYIGSLWQFVEREVHLTLRENWSVLEACQRWHSGAYLLETVPCALYILARHAHEPEIAILRAVNDTWDNDTIAAIVGAAVGALHGRNRLPRRWIEHLSGRTREEDDWHVFELIESAKQAFWKADPPISQENIRNVLQYLPVIQGAGFSPGEWEHGEGHFPYINYSDEALDFVKALAGNQFIQPFDWMNWVEGEQLVRNEDLLHNVGLQTLRKLLTAHVRSDRFSEGHLASMLESGHIARILQRMSECSGLHPPYESGL